MFLWFPAYDWWDALSLIHPLLKLAFVSSLSKITSFLRQTCERESGRNLSCSHMKLRGKFILFDLSHTGQKRLNNPQCARRTYIRSFIEKVAYFTIEIHVFCACELFSVFALTR